MCVPGHACARSRAPLSVCRPATPAIDIEYFVLEKYSHEVLTSVRRRPRAGHHLSPCLILPWRVCIPLMLGVGVRCAATASPLSTSCELTVDLPLMSRGGQRKVKGAWRLPQDVAGCLAGGSAALLNLCRVRVLLGVILCSHCFKDPGGSDVGYFLRLA